MGGGDTSKFTRAGQTEATTRLLPHPAPAPSSVGPLGWSLAPKAGSLQVGLWAPAGIRASVMDTTVLIREGTEHSALRLTHLLKQLVSFHLSRARQRETKGQKRTSPPKQTLHHDPGSSLLRKTGLALGKWGMGTRREESLFLSGPLKGSQSPRDGAVKSTLA